MIPHRRTAQRPFLTTMQRRVYRKRKWKRVLWAAGILLLLYVYIGGDHGLYQNLRLRRERSKLRTRIEELQREQERLKQEIKLIQNDRAKMEKMARERFTMGKPNEKIYLIQTRKSR